jgi:hypothetical protein
VTPRPRTNADDKDGTPKTQEAREAEEAREAQLAYGVQESAPMPPSRGAPTDAELADVAARTGLNAALDDLVNTVQAIAPELGKVVEEWDTYAREDEARQPGGPDRAYTLRLLVDRTKALNDRLQKVAAPTVARA